MWTRTSWKCEFFKMSARDCGGSPVNPALILYVSGAVSFPWNGTLAVNASSHSSSVGDPGAGVTPGGGSFLNARLSDSGLMLLSVDFFSRNVMLGTTLL